MVLGLRPDIAQLTLPAKMKYLAIVRRTTVAIARFLPFNAQAIENLRIAVGEVCLNVVQHAYPKDKVNPMGEKLILSFLIYPSKLVVIVKDLGCGFDPIFVRRYIPRQDAGNPERLKMGMHIARTLVDEIEIDSQIGKGTQVRMTKYLSTDRDSDSENS